MGRKKSFWVAYKKGAAAGKSLGAWAAKPIPDMRYRPFSKTAQALAYVLKPTGGPRRPGPPAPVSPDDDSDGWSDFEERQGELEELQDKQEAWVESVEALLRRRGGTHDGFLDPSTDPTAYPSLPQPSVELPGPGFWGRLVPGNALHLWIGWLFFGAYGVVLWRSSAEQTWHAPACLAAAAALAILDAILTSKARARWRGAVLAHWQDQTAVALRQWRRLEAVRRTQFAALQSRKQPAANAARAFVALLASDMSPKPELHGFQTGARAVGVSLRLPGLDDLAPAHRFIELTNGSLSVRNIPVAKRTRFYRRAVARFAIRVAWEAARSVPWDLDHIEIRGVYLGHDSLSGRTSWRPAMRLRTSSEQLANLDLDRDIDELAAETGLTLRCTKQGELRPLKDESWVFEGAEWVAPDVLEESGIEEPPVRSELPEFATKLDGASTLGRVVFGVACAFGAALLFPWGSEAQRTSPPMAATSAAITTEPAEAWTPVMPGTFGSLCGAGPPPRRVDSGEWFRYECKSSSAVPASEWHRCLQRSEYTAEAGRGCPGEERCCPPEPGEALGQEPEEREWWCLCYTQKSPPASPATACRRSRQQCLSLESRAQQGRGEMATLERSCILVGGSDHPANLLGSSEAWQPSSREGAWWAPGVCLLRSEITERY